MWTELLEVWKDFFNTNNGNSDIAKYCLYVSCLFCFVCLLFVLLCFVLRPFHYFSYVSGGSHSQINAYGIIPDILDMKFLK